MHEHFLGRCWLDGDGDDDHEEGEEGDDDDDDDGKAPCVRNDFLHDIKTKEREF